MPDGSKRRRKIRTEARREWYASQRQRRWAAAFWDGKFEGWEDGRPPRETVAVSPPIEELVTA